MGRAIAAYRAAIDIDPKNPEAYEALAELFLEQEDKEAAIEILNESLENTESRKLKKLLAEAETSEKEDGAGSSGEEPAADAGENEKTAVMQEKDGNGTDTETVMLNEEERTEPGVSDGGYSINDEGYVTIGRYERDGDESNGPEPIEWEVLEDNGGSMLLISRYILDAQPYNMEDTDITWENCTLRHWLNKDFLNTAFTPGEQGLVQTVTLSNPDNAYFGNEGGNDTQDKLFCLSIEEIRNLYSFNSWDDDVQCGYSQALMTEATVQAVKNGAGIFTYTQEDYNNWIASVGYDESCIGRPCGWWWLRSPGNFSISA